MTLALRKILDDHLCWLTSGGEKGRRADLSRCNLRGADLSDLDLTGVIFYKADLTNANLSGSCLCHANLARAVLREADLTGADMARANLRGADLTGVRNLTSVKNFWLAPHAGKGFPDPLSWQPGLVG